MIKHILFRRNGTLLGELFYCYANGNRTVWPIFDDFSDIPF